MTITARTTVLQRQGGLLLIAFGLIVSMRAVVIAQGKPIVHRDGQSAYRYDSTGIKLKGMLMERKVFGPPGYGETPSRDTRETILILKLSQGISVEPAADAEARGSANLDPAKNVRELQLFLDRSRRPSIQNLIGHEIVVTGTLNESLTASQYTKVWLDVATFSAN